MRWRRCARSAPTPWRLPVVHFSPGGRRLDQALVREFAAGPGAVLLCGRYEGVDQRFIDAHVTHEISLGDFVLSGGELPALALLDAVARLMPGVLSAPSHEQDSFSDGLLEGPQYSRPELLADRRRAGAGAAGAAVRPPCRGGALAARALAGADRAAPPRPDRRRAGRRPAGRGRRAVPARPRAIIKGFSILCRATTRALRPAGDSPHNTLPRGHDRLENPMDLISTLEHEEIARLNKKIPAFAPGDTVIVSVNVVEGTRKRVQAFEGVVIAKRNRSLNSSFIVRKVSNGEGVERTFQLYSPIIAGIEVKRRGDVRRAKLYFLRQRSGKSARIKEKLA